MKSALVKPEGLRERKRRETLARIAETGLKLFLKNGYEATSLDAVAEAAGISRRTFFYYFKSKEDVLLAWHDDSILQGLKSAIAKGNPNKPPLDVVRRCLLDVASKYETKESIAIDRLLLSTEALRACKEARFVEMERVLVESMKELWPAPSDLPALRMTAMITIGTLRLALENWRQGNAKQPLANYLKEAFVQLARQF